MTPLGRWVKSPEQRLQSAWTLLGQYLSLKAAQGHSLQQCLTAIHAQPALMRSTLADTAAHRERTAETIRLRRVTSKKTAQITPRVRPALEALQRSRDSVVSLDLRRVRVSPAPSAHGA